MSEKKKASKNKIIWIVIIAAVIVLGAVTAIFIKSRHMLSKETVVVAIEQEFEQLIGYDEESSPLIKAIHDGFEVEIKTVSRDKDTYKVTCILSNHNLEKALERIEISSDITLKEYAKKVEENFKKQERITYETQIVIVVENNKYRATFTEQQLNAATGGLIDSYNTMFKGGDK